jgi:hypothetical protein
LNGSSGRKLACENPQVRRTQRFGHIHPLLDFLQDLSPLAGFGLHCAGSNGRAGKTYTLFECQMSKEAKFAESVDLNQYPVISTPSMPRSTALRMISSMVILPAPRSLLYE